MKYTTLIVSTIILILMFSCDKSTTGPVGGGSIIGNWLESNAVVNLRLTTKSAQTAKNFLNSTGEIAVTGDYNKKLKMLIYITGEDPTDLGIIVTDGIGLLGVTDTSYIGLLSEGEGSEGEGNLIIGANDDTEFQDDLSGDVIYTFNEITLNVSNSTLQSEDTNLSVNLNGSITLEEVNIPGNTPTMLNSNASNFYEFGNTTTTFNEDSTFISSEDTGFGNDTGTWEIIGDTLKITTEQEVDDPISDETTFVDTTLSFNYVNYGNEVILSQVLDLCEGLPAESEDEDELTCKQMFNLIEAFTHVDTSSVVKAELIYQLSFERIPDNQVAKISDSSRSLLKQSLPNDILHFLNRGRQLVK